MSLLSLCPLFTMPLPRRAPLMGKTDPLLAVGSHPSRQGLFLFTCPSSSPPSLAKFGV